jgi:hypothetical protein
MMRVTCDRKGNEMKYMLMLYGDPALDPAYGTPEFDAMMAKFFQLEEIMKDRVKVLAGEGLLGVDTATTLRVRGGKVETMDGPFAASREQLGGFYLIEVANLDDAIAFAAEIPTAAWGSVEIRPVEEFE